ncbi:MAG: ABC transporter substrate-binding protein [Acetobacteraceae bacterium]|nr:ABC transporter substrate-binding protein [Acetobacteraceae bacterium]
MSSGTVCRCLPYRSLAACCSRASILDATAAPVLPRLAAAQSVNPEVTAPVQRLNAALLAIMKSGSRTSFQQRYEALAPVIEQTFDLQPGLQLSLDPRWASFSSGEQAQLMTAFRRYTVANYVANFAGCPGQSLAISPDIRVLLNGDRIVNTTIASPGKASHRLGYVMRQTPSGWKAVHVLAPGSISRVAKQRSDFRAVLSTGGSSALVATLERKVYDLSGGRLA